MYKYKGFDVITETNNDKFKVSIINIKQNKTLFEYEFKVYSNFDEQGLIDDAIFIYKRDRFINLK